MFKFLKYFINKVLFFYSFHNLHFLSFHCFVVVIVSWCEGGARSRAWLGELGSISFVNLLLYLYYIQWGDHWNIWAMACFYSWYSRWWKWQLWARRRQYWSAPFSCFCPSLSHLYPANKDKEKTYREQRGKQIKTRTSKIEIYHCWSFYCTMGGNMEFLSK